MNNPYFLTRQTANLMEDFEREIRRGSALYLLHGESGVGKSRLLHELHAHRLGDLSPRFVDMASHATVEDDGADQAEGLTVEQIEALFGDAAPNALIMVDHFEQASRKTCHQLLQGWSTDGIDKKLNLVVAVDSDALDQVRQLAQQFQVGVGSYRLTPLSAAETEAFAGFYLFPDTPVTQLSIPGALRRQLRRSRGVIARVREILDRDGNAIGAAAPDNPARAAGLRLAGAVLILALVGLLGWHWLGQGNATARLPTAPGGEP